MRLYALRHGYHIRYILKAASILTLLTLVAMGIYHSLLRHIDSLAEAKAKVKVAQERKVIANELAEAAYLRKANYELLLVLGGFTQMVLDEGGDYTIRAALSCKDARVKINWQLYRKEGR